MTVKKLILKDFTAFSDVQLEFSPGINVMLGANATGKTHVMKVLYSALRAWKTETQRADAEQPKESLKVRLRDKLIGVFRPDGNDLSRLVRRGIDAGKANVTVAGDKYELQFSFGESVSSVRSKLSGDIPRALFLPSREVLSFYPGFIGTYSAYDIQFDETYYDLCVALNTPPLKEPHLRTVRRLLKPLEEAFHGKVVVRNDRFYVKSKNEGLLEAQLLAEGFRKLATLAHLITNGALTEGAILFWDEPEASLNPNLVTVLAGLLQGLVQAGVQVILASHDYLLTNEISLAAEYATAAKSSLFRFFCFNRDTPTAAVQVQSAETLTEIHDNPILEEFAAHYDRQQALFVKTSREED